MWSHLFYHFSEILGKTECRICYVACDTEIKIVWDSDQDDDEFILDSPEVKLKTVCAGLFPTSPVFSRGWLGFHFHRTWPSELVGLFLWWWWFVREVISALRNQLLGTLVVSLLQHLTFFIGNSRWVKSPQDPNLQRQIFNLSAQQILSPGSSNQLHRLLLTLKGNCFQITVKEPFFPPKILFNFYKAMNLSSQLEPWAYFCF